MKRSFLIFSFCLFAVMQSMAAVPTTPPTDVPLAGHRGSIWGAENTREAFLNGIKAGYKYLETDVNCTKDGEFICCHEANLKKYKLDSASTIIAKTNWADLKDLTLTHSRNGKTWTGKLCSVAELLDICKEHNVIAALDIKDSKLNEGDATRIKALATLIKSKNMESKVLIMTSKHPCLEAMRAQCPNILLARFATPNAVMSSGVRDFCKTNKIDFCVALDPPANTGTISANHVKTAHNDGLKIGCYIVREHADLPKYKAMGVDFMTFEPTFHISSNPVKPELTAIVGTKAKTVATITGRNLMEGITVAQVKQSKPMFSVSPTTLPKEGGEITVTYHPTEKGEHTAVIYFESQEGMKMIHLKGTATEEPLPFTEGWNYSELSGQTADWASDFTTLRNLDFGAGKLYVVADGNKIVIVNAVTGALMATMSNEGVLGGAVSLVDCKYKDSKIIGCNVATVTSPLKVYVWDDDYAKPRVFLQTSDLGGFSRLGDCLGIRGNLTNGALFFAGNDASGYTSIVSYTITNGVCSTEATVSGMTDTNGNKIKFGTSPRVIPNSDAADGWWCMGGNHTVEHFSAAGKSTLVVNEDALQNNIHGNAFKSFGFDGTSYAIATSYDSDATDKRTRGYVALLRSTGNRTYDIIGAYPAKGLGTTPNTSYSTSVAATVNGTAGMEMWVLVHNQGVAYYKHGTTKAWNPKLTGTPPVATDIVQTETTTWSCHLQEGVLSVEGIEVSQIALYTLSGQKVCESQKSNTLPVDIPQGMYIAKVIDMAGVTYTEKVFVK